MDGLSYRIEQVEKEVAYHRKMLVEGNGKPGLTTRMEQAEDSQKMQSQQLTDVRKMFWTIVLLLLTILGGIITTMVRGH